MRGKETGTVFHFVKFSHWGRADQGSGLGGSRNVMCGSAVEGQGKPGRHLHIRLCVFRTIEFRTHISSSAKVTLFFPMQKQLNDYIHSGVHSSIYLKWLFPFLIAKLFFQGCHFQVKTSGFQPWLHSRITWRASNDAGIED